MKEKNQGITLIALIITIIIMLILVAVSISLALNSGLFKAAGKATQQWNTAQQEETEISGGKTQIGNEVYNTIEDYIGEITGTKEIHSWTRSGDTITCSHCSRTLTIGQEVAYGVKENVDSTEISQSALSSNTEDAKITTLEEKENDVEIKLMASKPTIPEYSRDTKWIIFGVEDKDKNGTNEALLITTLEPSYTRLDLSGADAYINGIAKIEAKVKELYGEEARAMTIEDVNNCLGYTPAGGMYYDGSTYKTTGNFTTKISELEIWPNIQSYNETNKEGKYYTPEYPEGTTDASKLGNYPLDGYYYSVSNDGTYLVDKADPDNTSHTVTTATKNLIFGASNDYYYWLASRGVCADSDYAYFGPGAVHYGFADSYGSCFHSDGYSGDDDFSFRAVVSLRSEIPAGV